MVPIIHCGLNQFYVLTTGYTFPNYIEAKADFDSMSLEEGQDRLNSYGEEVVDIVKSNTQRHLAFLLPPRPIVPLAAPFLQKNGLRILSPA